MEKAMNQKVKRWQRWAAAFSAQLGTLLSCCKKKKKNICMRKRKLKVLPLKSSSVILGFYVLVFFFVVKGRRVYAKLAPQLQRIDFFFLAAGLILRNEGKTRTESKIILKIFTNIY